MTKPNTPSVHLTLRISRHIRTMFYHKAQRYGTPSNVLRELIEAFIDDRLVIQPNPKKESLYVTRTKD